MGIDARMFVRTKSEITDDQLRRLAFELKWAFGDAIDRGNIYRHICHGLSKIEVYEQDGDAIKPEPGETFIWVDLSGRYYGPDYERGNAATLIAIGRWLDEKVPGGEVWYGGDSSGVCAKRFDESARDELWRHFVEHGHRPYQYYFGRGVPKVECDFCREPMVNNMSGPGRHGFSCGGCNARVLRYSTWQTVPCNENFEPIAKES